MKKQLLIVGIILVLIVVGLNGCTEEQDADYWYNKGGSFYNNGEFEEALEAFEKAIELNIKHENAWFYKGVTLSYLDRDEEAIEAYDNATNLNQDYIDAWNRKAYSFGNLGRF